MIGHATVILVETPKGIPLVMDPTKPQPFLLKLPGGKFKPGETPEQTGMRELEEETGLVLAISESDLVYEEDRKSHTFHLARISAPSLDGLKKIGNEGEIVKVFSKEEMQKLPNILPSHREILTFIGFF